MTNQADQSARTLPSGLLWRAGQIARRGLRELAARLWAAFWQVVIVAVIMASLVGMVFFSIVSLVERQVLRGIIGN